MSLVDVVGKNACWMLEVRVEYLRGYSCRDTRKILHFFAETGPWHGAVEANAHAARGSDDECQFRLHGELWS